ncbi:MAG: PQQ-binding-like beta-propeller repeat protein [Verrucomicrobiota bacterium]
MIAKTFLPALVLASFTASATEWSQWRGPNRNGVINDPKHTLTALPKELNVLWRSPAGNGQAGVVTAGGKVIFLDEQNGREVANCIDATTGKPVWKTPFAPAVDFKNAYGPGPRCTPQIDGDRVYVQSCMGEFQCLSLKDGKKIWGISFEKDFGATFFGAEGNQPEAKETAARRHGNNGCSVIDGDRLVVAVGSPENGTLVCFDKATGKKLWSSGTDNAAYSSLVVGDIAGFRQVIHLNADALTGTDIKTGKQLWRVPLKTGAKRHIFTPLIVGDTVTVASHSIGTIKFKITKAGDVCKATEVWKNAVKTNIATPVLVNGYLYNLGPGANTAFTCMDFETGETKWTQPGFGDYASIMAFGDKLLVLNATGEMFLIKANPQKYEELGRLQVAGKTWSHPAYSDGKLYVRDGKQVFGLELIK